MWVWVWVLVLGAVAWWWCDELHHAAHPLRQWHPPKACSSGAPVAGAVGVRVNL